MKFINVKWVCQEIPKLAYTRYLSIEIQQLLTVGRQARTAFILTIYGNRKFDCVYSLTMFRRYRVCTIRCIFSSLGTV